MRLKEHGIVDMVLAALELQEKCQEQNNHHYSTYGDVTNASDTLSRDSLWKFKAKYGCHEKFITIVRQFHDSMYARVQENGGSSVAFPITNRVKQGNVLDPLLFSTMFSAMILFTQLLRSGRIWHNVKF